MLKIIDNGALTAIADKEEVSFPASNVLTDFKSQVWKSTDAEGLLTIEVSSKKYSDIAKEGLYIGNTNAYKVIVVIKQGVTTLSTATYELGDSQHHRLVNTSLVYSSNQYIYGALIIESPGDVALNDGFEMNINDALNVDNQVFQELESVQGNYSLELTFSAIDDPLFVGIVRAGTIYEFLSPMIGLKENEIDNSIVRKLAGGAVYTKQRNKQRSFSGSFDIGYLDHHTHKSIMQKGLYDGIACELHTLNNRAMIYGRLTSPTKIDYNNITLQRVNFAIMEQI